MHKKVFLCAGLQSGGTTLVSWCFLQRPDCNGVLDVPHDMLHTAFDDLPEPIFWLKMTIASFRWEEASVFYRSMGLNPEPLLVVREVRSAYASLKTKPYGLNGITAEDPPLQLRFWRFLQDWNLFRQNGWPILRYEDLIADGEKTLRTTCTRLGIDWDEGMVYWRKPFSSIAYAADTNKTFGKTFNNPDLYSAIKSMPNPSRPLNLCVSEIEWLDETFENYNITNGYAESLNDNATLEGKAEIPKFENTTRCQLWTTIHTLQTQNIELRLKQASAELLKHIATTETILVHYVNPISLDSLPWNHLVWQRQFEDITTPDERFQCIQELLEFKRAGASVLVIIGTLPTQQKVEFILNLNLTALFRSDDFAAFDLRDCLHDSQTQF